MPTFEKSNWNTETAIWWIGRFAACFLAQSAKPNTILATICTKAQFLTKIKRINAFRKRV